VAARTSGIFFTTSRRARAEARPAPPQGDAPKQSAPSSNPVGVVSAATRDVRWFVRQRPLRHKCVPLTYRRYVARRSDTATRFDMRQSSVQTDPPVRVTTTPFTVMSPACQGSNIAGTDAPNLGVENKTAPPHGIDRSLKHSRRPILTVGLQCRSRAGTGNLTGWRSSSGHCAFEGSECSRSSYATSAAARSDVEKVSIRSIPEGVACNRVMNGSTSWVFARSMTPQMNTTV
jgi:hypothetical protein